MIAWFARNGVAANLLMLVIVITGLYSVSNRTPLEVFPSFELDIVNITVLYRGATPAEAEEAVVLRIEEAIFDIEGIEKITAVAHEGGATVSVEVADGYEPKALLDEIKNKVDAINSFPAEIERPIYASSLRKREVIAVGISGEVSERQLRELGERVRDDLSALPEVSQVELDNVRDYEISIEVSTAALDAYGLSLQAVAEAVRSSSLDLAAGEIRSSSGDLLIRTVGQAYGKADFADVVVLSRNDGTRVTLADVATIKDGFEDTPLQSQFNGKPGVIVEVYRVGDQSAIVVADAVKTYVAEAQASLPSGISMTTWRDRSRIVKARLATLSNSAIQGGILIFILLALFLRFSVAVWVCIGIPVSFMGVLAIMPELGVTINIVSLFAFILVLGIVVDDAIVTGENIYAHLQKSGDPTRAAIEGTQEVTVPVTFGVLTTAAAFAPILFMGGDRGAIFAQIPMIVIPVLLFSLVESKLILPSHLKHLKVHGDKPEQHNIFVRWQRGFADGFERFVFRFYRPVLEAALRQRYLVWSIFVAGLIIVFAVIASGALRFVFFPRVQSESATASLSMPAGTPFATTQRHVELITNKALQLQDKYIDPGTGESIILNISSVSGSTGSSGGAHIGRVRFEILSPEQRSLSVTSTELANEWRRLIGAIPGAQDLSFRAEIGRGGAPLDVQITGRDIDQLSQVAGLVRQRLAQYPGVFDIADNLSDGKREVQLTLKPGAEQLGISLEQLARQVRNAFFGVEAQRIQRGRDDVRVMVRLPEQERQNLATLEQLRIRTSAGLDVPFSEVADASYARSFSNIRRIDRERVVNITGDVDKANTDIEAVKRDLDAWLAETLAQYPAVRSSLEGEAAEQRESMSSLLVGLGFVLFVIYGLLAIPFKSYGQPIIVMSVIPFGIIGAVLGHMLLGMDLSILSVMGMLALTGVVVNDSLVLVDYVNQRRKAGMALLEAVSTAGVRRFRAVMLTSITTFAGVTPLLLEKSTQAQFLIPMAVSLGFGVLFATLITLVLIPVNYMILEDVKAALGRLFRLLFGKEKAATN